jgi:hypothetical protein
MKFINMAPLIAASSLFLAPSALGVIRITEFMYDGVDKEFFELTNVGSTAIDVTGWSYDDNSAVPGLHFLSIFGVIAPNESVVVTEGSEAIFRNRWRNSPTTRLLTNNHENFTSSDRIHIWDASNTLVDTIATGRSGLRADGVSATTSIENLGQNNIAGWYFSSLGDRDRSYLSLNGNLGSPGIFNPAPVPEPATLVLLSSGLATLVARKRRKRAK